MQSRGTAALPPPPVGEAASLKRLTKVAYLQFATQPVWVQNPDSQPTKVIPPITSSVPPRHQSLVRSVMALSLTSNRYRKRIPLLELRCPLQSPAMRSNAGMANRQLALLAWLGLAWLGLAWLGLAWLGLKITLIILSKLDGILEKPHSDGRGGQ
jgi:hypothetical protein